MSKGYKQPIAISCALTTLGCAGVPELPPPNQLPMKQIVEEVACQLSSAFRDIDQWKSEKDPLQSRLAKNFEAQKWTIGVTVTPKTTTDFQVSLTGSGTNNPKGGGGSGAKSGGSSGGDSHLPTVTWALAPSTGIYAERLGDTGATVAYTMHSSIFFESKLSTPESKKINAALQAYCNARPVTDSQSNQFDFVALSSDLGPNPQNHDLIIRRNLGIENWLSRMLEPTADGVFSIIPETTKVAGQGQSSAPKTPSFTYTTHLSLTIDGGVGTTWSPPGALLHLTGLGPAVTGKRNEDVMLQIQFVYDPQGGNGKSGPQAAFAVQQGAAQQQLLQTLQQLQLQVQ